ncbi:hypothetical protein RO3G_14120 [Rhizopus delemar RA 99-880]|uniref:Uncharacterized protein n=1 Tax=Rhizopus delemar (strain RA 99-880 / ATCC MYA-4621 / FGSC 9543 / NRRL 43880) TaxID=246409 RepID=I1CLS9_RHIO9|nr:hypothetical protein RO3G_14120 [Rhizopus delemar RA 99-880]|eukprot:EIE89409.1 hypothetical protein RO3G_14120 [Rhizopus delemar RA 99-880]
MKTYDQKLIHKCKHLICINIEKFKRIEISTKSKRSSKVHHLMLISDEDYIIGIQKIGHKRNKLSWR